MKQFGGFVVLFSLICVAGAVPAWAQDDILPLEDPVPKAMSVVLTNNGLDFLEEDVAKPYVNSFDLLELIGTEPLYDEDDLCIWGDGRVRVSVTSVDFDPFIQLDASDIDLSFQPFQGQSGVPQAMYAKIVITNLVVGIKVQINDFCSISSTVNADAEADSVNGLATLQVVYNEATPETPASLGVNVPTASASISGFRLDIGWPDLIEDILLGLVNPIVEGIINDIIKEEIASLLEDMFEEYLSAIPLSGEFPIEALGQTLSYDFGITQFTFADPDFFGIKFNGYVGADGVSDCVDLGDNPGSVFTNNLFPEYSLQAPNNQPYHAGVAVSDDLLNKLAYTTYSSGLLCLTLDDSFLGKSLNVNQFQRVVPSLMENRLRGGGLPMAKEGAADDDDDDTGPVEGDTIFVLQPQAPPVIELLDGNPNLLRLVIEDMGIGMYEWIADRWARTLGLTLSTDLDVGFELTENVLYVTIEEPALVTEIAYNEYSGMNEEQVAGLLDLVMGVAWPMVEEFVAEGFALPTFQLEFGEEIKELGYELVYAGRAGEGNDFLGIYASLSIHTVTPPPQTSIVLGGPGAGRTKIVDFAVLDVVQSAEFGLSDALDLVVDVTGADEFGNASGLEYSYRIDGGFWSRFSPDTRIYLPAVLEGEHLLEVRARNEQGYVDKTPATVRFVADGVAPVILDVNPADGVYDGLGGGVEVSAYDWQTAPQDMLYSLRVDGGAWSRFGPADGLRVPSLGSGMHDVEVRAMDAAGNISDAGGATVNVSGADEPSAAGGSGSGAACGLAGTGGAPLALLVLVLGALGVMRRRFAN